MRATDEVREWLRALRKEDLDAYRSVNSTIDLLAETGPGLGRPLVDTLSGTKIRNMKELRPRSGREVSIRIIFVFDPWFQAVLLIAGNKAREWNRWYRRVIPAAEAAFEKWLVAESERRASDD